MSTSREGEKRKVDIFGRKGPDRSYNTDRAIRTMEDVDIAIAIARDPLNSITKRVEAVRKLNITICKGGAATTD